MDLIQQLVAKVENLEANTEEILEKLQELGSDYLDGFGPAD